VNRRGVTPDLCGLNHLHEAGILDNLHRRWLGEQAAAVANGEGSGSSNSVNSTDKSAQNKAASKKADQNDEGSTNGKPLWKKGDVLEGVAWQRGGGLWQQAVVLEAWGAAFGDQTPRAHVGNNAAATAKARATGGGGASLSGSTEGSAANSLTAQALTPLNPAVVYIKH
jgi:hypothetical protein